MLENSLQVTDNIILPHCGKVCDRSEGACAKDLIHGRHFGVSSHPSFLPGKAENHNFLKH